MNRVFSTTRENELTLLAIGVLIMGVVLWGLFSSPVEFDQTAAVQQLANVYGVEVDLKP